MKTPIKLIKVVIVALVILFSQFAEGSNYYFSSSIGDDSRTSLQVRNPATPWKTITKLNSYFTSLVAGDSVLFNKGDVFAGTITPAISGTAANPIIISSYGSGAKPVISGFQTVTGWTNQGSGIYSKAITVQSTPNMVTVNGMNTPKGRYPNSSYLSIDSHSGSTSLTDAGAPNSATANWTGAEVVMKRWHWVIDRCNITNHSGTTFTVTGASGNISNGYGYFLQNDLKALDEIGDWAYRSGKLYMYFGAANPNTYTVKVSTIDKLLNLASKNYISIKNLVFEGANVTAIQLEAANNISITNCDILFSGGDAILCNNSDYATVSYCTIDEAQNDAFAADTYGGSGDHVTFSHNYVRDIYMYPGMSGSGNGKGFNVSMQVDNGLVEYNTIKRVGYFGVILGGNNTIVRNNIIDSTNLIKDDGGGIYVSGAATDVMTGRVIENNIVTNAIGNGSGTSSGVSEAYGIYVDGTGNNVTIQNNTITKSSNAGLFMGFFTHHINILNNTIIDNSPDLLIVEQNTTNNNFVINGNIFGSTGTYPLLVLNMGEGLNVYRPISSLGTWAGNYFVKPFDDNGVARANFNSPSQTYIEDGYTVAGWSQFDATAHGLPFAITPYTTNSIIGSNKFSNEAFTSNVNGASLYYQNGTGSATWDNTNKINGGSLKVSYSVLSTYTSVMKVRFDIGALKTNTKYILKYDILGSNTDRANEVYLGYGGAIYTPRYKYQPFTNTVTLVEVLLEPNTAAATAQVFLNFRETDGTVYIDNIEFYEANIIKANPDDFIRFEYNETQSTKTIVLDEAYLGVDSTIYSGSITLLPYTSIVLIKSAVISANHIPTIQNQNFQLNENKPNGSVVGTVVATDPDAGQTLSYSILSGNTNGAFAINASTGVLSVANAAEIKVDLTLVIKVQDNGTGNLSSQATISINIIHTGIKLTENNQSIKVYPNPVSDELIIEIKGNTDNPGFEILNSTGQIIFKGNLSEKTVVQTSNFSPGVYLIKIENGKTLESKKIVKV